MCARCGTRITTTTSDACDSLTLLLSLPRPSSRTPNAHLCTSPFQDQGWGWPHALRVRAGHSPYRSATKDTSKDAHVLPSTFHPQKVSGRGWVKRTAGSGTVMRCIQCAGYGACTFTEHRREALQKNTSGARLRVGIKGRRREGEGQCRGTKGKGR